MRRNPFIAVLFGCLFISPFGIPFSARGQGNEYDVNNIPASLKQDAEAVVRTYCIQFEVKTSRKAVEKVKKAVTIFNKEKQSYGNLVLPYNSFRSIDDLEGAVYDARGNKVRTLNSDDIKDFCDFSNYALYSDARVRTAELYYDQYPYTIEYSYEYSYKGFLHWPTWFSRTSLDAIESSRFIVTIPEEENLRYWCNSDTVQPEKIKKSGTGVYAWEAKNLAKLSKDVVGEDIEDVATIVRIAPSLFELDGFPGDMRTWKDFGKWDFALAAGKDILPESALQEIRSCIHPSDDLRTKVKKLYQYMQKRTRYVSIQLGIGGWQPFDAAYVHERGYGDCKALSNYMIALLKAIEITGYAVNIRPGRLRFPFLENFPNAHFTHVIVCVPLKSDTVWLECTSQSMPFNHIGRSNENRGALLLSPDGGVVVHTPKSTPGQNVQIHHAAITFNSYGNAEAHVTISNTGNQGEHIRMALDEATPQERERWISHYLDIPNFTITDYSIQGIETCEDEIGLSLRLALPKYASASGNRIFFYPNVLERATFIPPDISQRLSPIRYEYPYRDVDTVVFTIPRGYTFESVPKEVHLTPSFGEFISKTTVLNDSVIVYTRLKEVRVYTLPAKEYTEYRKFSSGIVKADRAQVVLRKK